MTIAAQDTVEFHTPDASEVGVTYAVVEMNGDRCIIQALAKDGVPFAMTFKPQMTVRTSDLRKAS